MMLDGKAAKEMGGAKVLRLVHGARKFGPISGIPGLTRFEGCSIIEFDKESSEKIDSGWKLITAGAKQTHEVGGDKVMELEASEQWAPAHKWSVFVVRPDATTLLAGTNLDFVKEVLARRNQKEKPKERALPDTLKEWQDVNRSADIWGLHHFNPKEATVNETSILRADNLFRVHDEKAIGMSFFIANEGKECSVFLLSSNAGIVDTFATFKEHLEGWPATEKVRDGAIKLHFDTAQQVAGSIMVVSWLLGQAFLP